MTSPCRLFGRRNQSAFTPHDLLRRETLDSGEKRDAGKDVDVWAAPPAGYRGGAKPEVFTYRFE